MKLDTVSTMNTELIKLAYKLGYKQSIIKAASPFSDIGLAMLSPVNGAVASSIGSITGQMSNPATDNDIDEYDEHPFRALAPGVASHRIERRLKKALTNSSGNASHYISQYFGLPSATISGAGLGALIGALVSKNNRKASAGVGAISGAVVPPVIAAIAALISKRRDKEKHNKYIESSTVPEYLVPGLALYNRFKTLGYAQGDSKERERRKRETLATLVASDSD